MKRFEKCKRILAFLLVALMVVQQGSVTTLAEELSADTQNIQTQEEASETTEENKAENVTPDADNSEGQSESTPAPSETEPTATPEAAEPTAAPTQAATAEVTGVPEQETETTPEAAVSPEANVSEVPAETKTEFTGTVDNATATVNLTDAISADAAFVAKQYDTESEYFTNNAEAAVAQWAENNNLTVLDTIAYDMHFEENGQEIAVSQHADVNLTFNTPVLTQTSTDVTSNIYVLHIVNGQAVTAGTATQNADGAVTAANISTDGFSPFVFVKAVSGDAVETTATDHTTDLNRLVTDITVTVDGKDATKKNGVYQVKPDTDYIVKLKFAESEDLQFANNDDGKLYYTLPAGLTIPADIPETTFSIGSLEGNTFSYTKNSNQIVVTLNTKSANYEEFKKSATAYFSINFDARFSNEVEEVVFGSTKTITVHVDSTNKLTLAKKADYNSKNGTVTYTVTVKSEGNNSNVVLTDNLSGTWLEMFTADDVRITSNSQKQDLNKITKAIDGRTMTVTIPSMSHGEEIKITYTVNVDYDQMKPSSVDDIVNATTNTVTGNWDVEHPVSVNLKDKGIYNPSIKKDGTIDSSNNNITYTVTLNDDYRYDISGKVITDSVNKEARKFFKYTGNGINIKKYEAGNGQPIDEKDIPWAEITRQDSKDYTWSYTIPSTDAGKYKYVITYTAQGINHEITGATVTNKISYDLGGESSKGIRVNPIDGILGVSKSGEIITDPATGNRQIKWRVTFNVPANKEYTNCSIVDTLPSETINKIKCIDAYVKGSETFEGLLDDEQYEIVQSSDKSGITVNFYYMQGNTRKNSLKVSDKDRIITFSYLTEPDPIWLANSNSLNNKAHTNSVIVKARGQQNNPAATATINIYKSNPEIKKTSSIVEKDKNNNATVIQYDVTILGVDDDAAIEILDEFNKDQLVYDNSRKAKLSYSENGKNFTEDKNAVITPTDNDTGLLFTITNFHKNVDENHAVYRLTYYLKVNGTEGLESIETSGEGGVVENKAIFRGKSDTEKTTVIKSNGIVKKDLVNKDTIAQDKYIAEYSLVINPGMKKYGKSNVLKVNDVMTNMEAIDPDAVKIETTPADKAKEVVTTFTDKGIEFTVPNSTKVDITYKAKWTGTGSIDHTNTVTVYGYSQSVNKKVNVASTGEGDHSNLSLKVFKCEEGNSQKYLPGAEFKLQYYKNGSYTDVLDKNGKPVTFTTGDTGINVLAGDEHNLGWVLWSTYKYQLIETKAPDGYVLDPTPHQFTFSKNLATDDVKYCGDSGQLIIYNKPIEVEISKTDITGKTELKGAHIQIVYKDKDDKETVFTEWDSDGKKAYTVTGLVAGKTYILRETKAPEGYTLASDTTFVLKEDGTIDPDQTTANVEDGKFVIRDTLTSVDISKKAVDGKDELEGAHLQIVYKDEKDQDKIFAEWDSDGKKAHTVTGLVAGRTYILRETKAPDGYTLAPDTTFVLKEDGTIDPDHTTANVEDGKLVIRDTLTSVDISKKAVGGKDELEGAHLQIVYNDKDDKETVFTEWDSDGKKAHTVTGLVAGKTYILRETKAPAGYTLASDTTFVLKEDGTIDPDQTTANVEDGKLVIRDALTSVSIKKTDIVDGKALAGATLQIA